MTVAKHLFIDGRVQGVYYRATTQKQAQEMGLKGWVRNLPDGRVEAWLQGEPEVVSRMVIWCYDGPPWARVDSIDTEDVAPDEALSGFRVRY